MTLFALVAAVTLTVSVATTAALAGTDIRNVGGVEIIVTNPESVRHGARRTRPTSKPANTATGASVPADPFEERPLGLGPAVVRVAMSYLGVPYVWGGQSPSGFDCSGYTWFAYSRIGVRIPRTADLQFAAGKPVAGDPLPGDLVFFQTYDYGASHVGIYLGEGRFVNAIGADVHVTTFRSEYFRSRYLGARRFLTG